MFACVQQHQFRITAVHFRRDHRRPSSPTGSTAWWSTGYIGIYTATGTRYTCRPHQCRAERIVNSRQQLLRWQFIKSVAPLRPLQSSSINTVSHIHFMQLIVAMRCRSCSSFAAPCALSRVCRTCSAHLTRRSVFVGQICAVMVVAMWQWWWWWSEGRRSMCICTVPMGQRRTQLIDSHTQIGRRCNTCMTPGFSPPTPSLCLDGAEEEAANMMLVTMVSAR